MKNIFDQSVTEEVIQRINQLTPETKPLWGKMTVSQMLAHCSVSYEMVYEEDKHPKPNALVRFVLTQFIKDSVVGDKPYPRNGRTAPAFRIKEDKNFEEEKARLIAYLHTTQQLGEDHFDGQPSHSFGVLTKQEWNTMFYKHLDHHLRQFGA